MTAILASLAVLLGGAVFSVLLARAPRIGLLIAMSSIVGASILCATLALPCLTRGSEASTTTLPGPCPGEKLDWRLTGCRRGSY